MSYETQATATLQAAVEGAYRGTYLAGSHLARARNDAAKASDLVEVLARTIDLLVAAEALHDAADAAVATLRAVLAETMNDTGATTIQATHHSAHLARKPAYLDISAEATIPDRFWVQPPKAIDRSALKSALKDGAEVPGAILQQPNSMSLVIRAKKEQAA